MIDYASAAERIVRLSAMTGRPRFLKLLEEERATSAKTLSAIRQRGGSEALLHSRPSVDAGQRGSYDVEDGQTAFRPPSGVTGE